jgi:hypothetical protein
MPIGIVPEKLRKCDIAISLGEARAAGSGWIGGRRALFLTMHNGSIASMIQECPHSHFQGKTLDAAGPAGRIKGASRVGLKAIRLG